jgi:hypothetical protein
MRTPALRSISRMSRFGMVPIPASPQEILSGAALEEL